MHRLLVYKDKGAYDDYTSIVGNVSWASSEDTLGVQLDFDVANNQNQQYLEANSLAIGSMLGLVNGKKEIIRAIAVTEELSRVALSKHYTAFDFAFYLNKSKGIYQFNGISATAAIMRVLNDFGIQVGGIANIPTIINYIYWDKVISDIIKDILAKAQEETGQKYRMEMRGGALYIEKQTDLVINATFKLASNIGAANITSAISNPTRRRSIEELKNSIVIVINDKENARLVSESKDEASIKKYGLLQEVHSIDEKDIAQAKNIADNLLKDFNRIIEDNSITCIGNDDVRAGRILRINEPQTGMSGLYRIKSCVHNLNKGIHTMSLNLGVI